MAEPETVKVELELPRDQVHIEPAGPPSEGPVLDAESEQAKLEKTRRIMAEQSPRRRLQKLRQELLLSRKAKDDETVKSNPSAQLNLLAARPLVKDTSPPNHHQKTIIAAGLAVALLGLFLWPLTSFFPALGVALIGGAIVTTGTFVKV
jgi:hypothetical protein